GRRCCARPVDGQSFRDVQVARGRGILAAARVGQNIEALRQRDHVVSGLAVGRDDRLAQAAVGAVAGTVGGVGGLGDDEFGGGRGGNRKAGDEGGEKGFHGQSFRDEADFTKRIRV